MSVRRVEASIFGRLFLWLACAGAFASAAAALFGAVSPLAPALAFVALVAVTSLGVASPSSGVFARPLLAVETARPEIALTFDDGPDPQWTPRVLEALEAGGHRATFFVVGKRADAHPELVAEIARRGHEIANHTWEHAYTTVFAAPAALADELGRVNELVQRHAGTRPAWFRAPVGLLSPRIAPGVRRAGLGLVSWTASARDGVATTPERVLARLGRCLVPGAILVLHDAAMQPGREPVAVRVLPELLARLEARGLRGVTLSALVQDGSASGPESERLVPSTPSPSQETSA